MSSVVAFPRQRLGQYLRVGRAHRQLEFLYKSGRLPVRRAVFEASLIDRQVDFLRDLGTGGVELILDTNVAELSAEGRFSGSVQGVPWAIEERPLFIDDFLGKRGAALADKIAKFAVERGVDAVISPSHLLTGVLDPYLTADREISTFFELLLIAQVVTRFQWTAS